MIRDTGIPQITVHEIPSEDLDTETAAREAQALSEGVKPKSTVECMGEHYQVADRVGLMPLMKFAHAASKGIDSTDMDGLNAIYEMLRDCIHEDDWGRFQDDMVTKKGFVDELLPVVQQAIQVITSRPTTGPSDSSTSSAQSTAESTERSFPGLVPVRDLAG